MRALAGLLPGIEVEAPPPAAERAARLAGEDFVFVGHRTLAEGSAVARARFVFDKGSVDRHRPYLLAVGTALAEAVGFPPVPAGSPLATPSTWGPRRPGRLVLHGDSSTPRKEWGAGRLLALAAQLARAGLDPVVLCEPARAPGWEAHAQGRVPVRAFGDLAEVARFLGEVAAAVAMDSGIAHLASAAGTPVVAVHRRASAARFWRPAWGVVRPVAPALALPPWLAPRLWRALLPPARVARAVRQVLRDAGPSTASQAAP